MTLYVGAIDQGTTSTRFILFNKFGELVTSHQVPLPNIFPHAGWQEIDPIEIFNSVIACMQGVLDNGYSADQVASIGLTNQRETTIVWNKMTGKPYYNAIVWCDTRTEELVSSIIAQSSSGQDLFRSETGLPISTYFSALKIKWLLEHCQEFQYDMATCPDEVCIGTVDSWLLYKLTGEFATDIVNASRTLLFNINTLQWDPTICEFFGIHNISNLPTVHHNTHNFGTIFQSLPFAGLSINGCIGDQQASLLGFGCLDYADVKCTYGTGCFLLMNTGKQPIYSQNGLLTTIGFSLTPPVDGKFTGLSYALEGSVASCGSLFQWLIDSMKVAKSSQELCDFAIECEDNADIIIVPAFTGLLAPHWCLDARGLIIGLTRYTNNKHLCRAVLESICMQTRDVVIAMCNDVAAINSKQVPTDEIITAPLPKNHRDVIKQLKIDGGVTKSHYLCTFQSGVLDIPVLKAIMQERTALGAAIAAGLGSGFFSSLDEVNDLIWHNGQDTPLTPQSSSQPKVTHLVSNNTTIFDTSGLPIHIETPLSPSPTSPKPRKCKYDPHVITNSFKIFNSQLHKQSKELWEQREKNRVNDSNSNDIEALGELDDSKYFDFNFEKFVRKWAVAVEKCKGWSSIE